MHEGFWMGADSRATQSIGPHYRAPAEDPAVSPNRQYAASSAFSSMSFSPDKRDARTLTSAHSSDQLPDVEHPIHEPAGAARSQCAGGLVPPRPSALSASSEGPPLSVSALEQLRKRTRQLQWEVMAERGQQVARLVTDQAREQQRRLDAIMSQQSRARQHPPDPLEIPHHDEKPLNASYQPQHPSRMALFVPSYVDMPSPLQLRSTAIGRPVPVGLAIAPPEVFKPQPPHEDALYRQTAPSSFHGQNRQQPLLKNDYSQEGYNTQGKVSAMITSSIESDVLYRGHQPQAVGLAELRTTTTTSEPASFGSPNGTADHAYLAAIATPPSFPRADPCEPTTAGVLKGSAPPPAPVSPTAATDGGSLWAGGSKRLERAGSFAGSDLRGPTQEGGMAPHLPSSILSAEVGAMLSANGLSYERIERLTPVGNMSGGKLSGEAAAEGDARYPARTSAHAGVVPSGGNGSAGSLWPKEAQPAQPASTPWDGLATGPIRTDEDGGTYPAVEMQEVGNSFPKVSCLGRWGKIYTGCNPVCLWMNTMTPVINTSQISGLYRTS